METGKKSSESNSKKKGLESGKTEKSKDKKKKLSVEQDSKKSNNKTKRGKEQVDSTKVIRLLGNRSVYHVSVEEFVRVSQLIKQQQTAGNLMTTADLHRFSDQSIMAFVNFVQNREIKSALTYYAITELVTLAHTFQMKELKMALEDSIIDAAKSSEADLLQTMIICDVAILNPETEKSLQMLAVEQIEKLVGLPDFHKMPFHQLFQVLSSCELPVTHEMFVADVVLLWLVGQNHVNTMAPSLLSCIRTKFLSPVDRTLIIERINQLNMPNKMVRLARNMLESTNNQRVCLDPIHVKRNLGRCGVNVNLSRFNPHSSLPLSRPNFNMKMNKAKETNKKHRPTFDPKTAPKVMDLMTDDPKGGSGSSKKKNDAKSKSKKSEASGKKKSRCACLDYVRNKMSRKKEDSFYKDPNAVKIRPPGASSLGSSSKDSTTKDSTAKDSKESSTKHSISSKLSSSSKTSVNSSASEKRIEKRRADKRSKIQSAINSSKSAQKSTDTSSRFKKNTNRSDKSEKSEMAGKPLKGLKKSN